VTYNIWRRRVGSELIGLGMVVRCVEFPIVLRGADVDQPRNLAKSVTVE
jgi:hypothetical protein